MTIDTTRGRSARLDPAAVLAAAEAIVDRDGHDAPTMKRLAADLAARVPSLGNHVASPDNLRTIVEVRARRRLGREVRRAATSHAGADGGRGLSRTLRPFVRAHPQRCAAITRPAIDPEACSAVLPGSNLLEVAGHLTSVAALPATDR